MAGRADSPEKGAVTCVEAHRVLLRMIKEVDRICAEHGLVWCAAHGTLLGAVRHQGFIPWDDDADLLMPRESYERFLAVAPRELADGLVLQTPRSDAAVFNGGHARLLDTDFSGEGGWADIMPLDWCDADDVQVEKQQRAVRHRQRLLYAKTYPGDMWRIADANPKKLSLYYGAAARLSRERLCDMLDKACTAHAPSDRMAVFAAYRQAWSKNRLRFFASELDDLVRLPFEDTSIPAPVAYDRWLSDRYGDDYLQVGEEAVPRFGVGFTAGVFDLFHIGHLNLLRAAKERCDHLVVGVISDELCQVLKKKAPVIPFEERLAIVGAIDCVDEVMRIESEELLSKVEAWYARPFDVAFSGSDHATDPYWQMEEQILSTLGARIEYLPYTQSTSSTLIRRALEQGQGD